MLQQLDESLERYLRRATQLRTEHVAISFDPPNSEWGATLAAPTLNLFLWNIERNHDESASGQLPGRHGSAAGRSVGRVRLTAHYVVSAWTSAVADEHDLLGRVFAAIVSHPTFHDDDVMSEALRLGPGPLLRIGSSSERVRGDFWSGLGGRLRASLDMSVSLSVDAPTVLAGPPITGAQVRPAADDNRPQTITSSRRAGTGDIDRFAGKPVQSKSDVSVVDESGRFFIDAEVGEKLTVFTDPLTYVTVPEIGPIELN